MKNLDPIIQQKLENWYRFVGTTCRNYTAGIENCFSELRFVMNFFNLNVMSICNYYIGQCSYCDYYIFSLIPSSGKNLFSFDLIQLYCPLSCIQFALRMFLPPSLKENYKSLQCMTPKDKLFRLESFERTNSSQGKKIRDILTRME